MQCFTHYVALHTSPAGERFGRASGELPVTDTASTCLARLPVWNAMNWQHVWKVVAAVFVALGETPPPRESLRRTFDPTPLQPLTAL